MELVIMAGGLGSRFGGLKQLEPIDEYGNFIIDYSIFDAIRCGFDSVVIIIKEENLDIFRNTIGKRIESKIKTKYVFQDNSNVPQKYSVPKDRTRPLGTGHAVLCAKDKIESSFAVINADDFYGFDAYKVVSEFLKNNKDEDCYELVGFSAENTMTENGSVKRGVCEIEGETLLSITEGSITKQNGKYFALPIDGSGKPEYEILPNTIVSMNMFGLTKGFLEHLNSDFLEFLEENKNDLSSKEFFLPSVVSKLIETGKAKTKVINTTSKWYGITYREDLEEIKKVIKTLRAEGVYPENIWA